MRRTSDGGKRRNFLCMATAALLLVLATEATTSTRLRQEGHGGGSSSSSKEVEISATAEQSPIPTTINTATTSTDDASFKINDPLSKELTRGDPAEGFFALPEHKTTSDKYVLLDGGPKVPGGDPYGSTLSNYGANINVKGVRKHHPKTYDEVSSIVKSVSAAGGKLRVLGMAHSWSNIMPDDNSDVIFMDDFKAIKQDPNDYTLITIQAGVLNAELAGWADSPERGYGRFSYLAQNALIQKITFVGAVQTSSHGSGLNAPTPDYVRALTMIDADGEIRHYDQSHPDFLVLISCLGMCGIVLDITIQFDRHTEAVELSLGKDRAYKILPPRDRLNLKEHNPLKDFVEGAGREGGLIMQVPYNYAIFQGPRLDPSKIAEYKEKSNLFIASARAVSAPVKTQREGLPIWGTQHEPYYSKDLFVPEDWMTQVPGAMIHRSVFGDWRFNQREAFNAYIANSIPATMRFISIPAWLWGEGNVVFNTSQANSQHYVHYTERTQHNVDYEFSFKADDDYANIYEAWNTLAELNDEFFRDRDQFPLNVVSAMRWSASSTSPLSHLYGQPGEKFCLIEAIGAHGTAGWDEFTQELLRRWGKIRNKKDGSRPKPHWSKWYSGWTPQIIDYVKDVYGEQIKIVREVVLKHDPSGLFRNRDLCTIFDVPCRW